MQICFAFELFYIVVKIFFKDHQHDNAYRRDRFWSITTALGRRLSNNRDGRLYVGSEAVRIRLHYPGLYKAQNTVSFQLFGHSHVFVRHRADGGLYFDRSNRSLEFSEYTVVYT